MESNTQTLQATNLCQDICYVEHFLSALPPSLAFWHCPGQIPTSSDIHLRAEAPFLQTGTISQAKIRLLEEHNALEKQAAGKKASYEVLFFLDSKTSLDGSCQLLVEWRASRHQALDSRPLLVLTVLSPLLPSLQLGLAFYGFVSPLLCSFYFLSFFAFTASATVCTFDSVITKFQSVTCNWHF